MPDELREFAALVSTSDETWSPNIFADAAASAQSSAVKRRLYIATVWLVCGGRKCPWSQQLAAELKQSGQRISQGPQWAELAWLSNCHLLIKQKKADKFVEFLSKGIAAHAGLPPEQRRWLLATGARMAAEAGYARHLLFCAQATDDVQRRRWVGEQLKHLALVNCSEAANKSEEQLKAIIAQLRAAVKLGAALTGAQATAACVLSLAVGASRSNGAAPELPATIPAQPIGIAVAWMAARWASGARAGGRLRPACLRRAARGVWASGWPARWPSNLPAAASGAMPRACQASATPRPRPSSNRSACPTRMFTAPVPGPLSSNSNSTSASAIVWTN